MKLKSWATLGIGMLTGAAAIMLLPKQSSVYRSVDDAAMTVKRNINHAVDSITQ